MRYLKNSEVELRIVEHDHLENDASIALLKSWLAEVPTDPEEMRIAEEGQGPLVLLLHGWPESWYSWRHQLPALAAAGFHAVAPDMRGFGKTDKPAAVGDYDIQLHLPRKCLPDDRAVRKGSRSIPEGHNTRSN